MFHNHMFHNHMFVIICFAITSVIAYILAYIIAYIDGLRGTQTPCL